MQKLLLFLLLSITTSFSNDNNRLEDLIARGYSYQNNQPLLGQTSLSLKQVKELYKMGANPLATITDEGKTYLCLEKWAICALKATKKPKRNKKIEILIFMISHLLGQEKHEKVAHEAVAKVRKLLENHPKILHQLPNSSFYPPNVTIKYNPQTDTCDFSNTDKLNT